MDAKIQKTIDNLTKNNMRAFYVEKRGDVVPLIKTLMPKGASAGSGGSVTLAECGVIEFLQGGYAEFLDRERAAAADFYFSSSNAVTEDGDLYNVDGRANRVSAIAYGPKNVIIVVGVNKIVKTLQHAAYRVKTIAAPKNCVRLKLDTYCAQEGKCRSFKIFTDLGALHHVPINEGCDSDSRICCHYLVSGRQRVKERITVIIVGEELGY